MTGYQVLHVIGFRKFMRRLYRVEVIGGERIPHEGACILTPNHESIFDPFILAVATTRPIHFMTKAELFRHRPLAAVLRWLGTFPVERGSGDRTAMTQAARLLAQGGVLGIFPQGTSRQLTKKWHRGAARLALLTGAPLIPVRMTGTRAWPLRTRVRIEVGQPIAVAPGKPTLVAARELTRRLEAAIPA
jgi:1-acyl-sn-glycerol-3-phosphate acyltransferase